MFPAEVLVLLSNPSASLSAASGNKNFKKEIKKKNPNLHQYGFSCFSNFLPEANARYIPAIPVIKTVSRVQNSFSVYLYCRDLGQLRLFQKADKCNLNKRTDRDLYS